MHGNRTGRVHGRRATHAMLIARAGPMPSRTINESSKTARRGVSHQPSSYAATIAVTCLGDEARWRISTTRRFRRASDNVPRSRLDRRDVGHTSIEHAHDYDDGRQKDIGHRDVVSTTERAGGRVVDQPCLQPLEPDRRVPVDPQGAPVFCTEAGVVCEIALDTRNDRRMSIGRGCRGDRLHSCAAARVFGP